MTSKRPPGPVFRPDDNEDDDMNAASLLRARWRYLQDGAQLGGNLVVLAREHTMDELAGALQTMTRDQLEAACFAMVLVHAEGAPMIEPSGSD